MGVVIVAETRGRYSDNMAEFRTLALLMALQRC
jgi:hypothetical protein